MSWDPLKTNKAPTGFYFGLDNLRIGYLEYQLKASDAVWEKMFASAEFGTWRIGEIHFDHLQETTLELFMKVRNGERELEFADCHRIYAEKVEQR